MSVKIPQAVRDNAIWALIVAIGFLFAFYVNSTYVQAAELDQHTTDMVRMLRLDRLEDRIYTLQDDILMLEIYIEEDPESRSRRARERRLRELQIELGRQEDKKAVLLRGRDVEG